MPPDASALRAFLARASRRLAWLSAAEGAAAGLAIAFVLALFGWPGREALPSFILAGLALAGMGMLIRVFGSRGGRRQVAALVERRAPECRNLVITADELIGTRDADYVATIIYRDAARLVTGLDPRALFPARNVIAALAATGALWVFALIRAAAPGRAPAAGSAAMGSSARATIDAVEITVTPPAYSGRAAQSLRDPARVEALAGSHVRLTIRAHASRVSMATIRSRDSLAVSTANAFTAELIADADGYIALEPSTSGRAGTRRLIGISVTPDTPPRVRITAPARDLFLRDAHRTLDLAIEAGDDIGLASLRVRYTKVSGSGERFTFAEGEVPIQIARTGARAWTARASWNLDGLGLSPGDMVVYRAVAADHRPGATPTESDSYIAEVLAPGGEAAPGFEVDPEQERYAVSQQMVILKTERLLARRSSIAAEVYANESQQIAAEQRKVRAEFVFMLGGELADDPNLLASMTDINEETEANGEGDLAAGRSANAGHIALLRAIRSMSRAATSLTTADLTPALTHERAALAALETAFSRTRIILRALTTRERLDLSRRLTGVLTDAAREVHPAVEPETNARVTALRHSLAGIATLAGTTQQTADGSARASDLAQSVLQVDPSSKPFQDVAALLTSAASAIGNGRADEARRLLDRAATSLATVLRDDLLDAPRRAPGIADGRLSGALNDALRHPRDGTRGGTP